MPVKSTRWRTLLLNHRCQTQLGVNTVCGLQLQTFNISHQQHGIQFYKSKRFSVLRSQTRICAAMPHPPECITQRELRFTNSRGENLAGIYVDAGSPNVVILCHGYMGNMTMCQFPDLAMGLANAGISSYRFDHPMAWPRTDGGPAPSDRKGPFLMGNHDDEVQDMKDAVEFLRREGKTVVCLLGHSKGGTNAILYAARHGDLPKVINLSGRFECRQGVLNRFGADIMERLAAEKSIPRTEASGFEWVMTEEDFLKRVDLDMEGLARSISPKVKMMMLHGTGDAVINWQESQRAAELVDGSVLVTIDGADHNYSGSEHAGQMIEQVVQFVLDY